LITAAELIAASQPLRDLTKDERKQALKALGVDPNSTVETRVCTRCESEKPITEYHVKGKDEVGLLYNRMCKHCCQVRQAAYRRNAFPSKRRSAQVEGK
jgi:hypothetical protein